MNKNYYKILGVNQTVTPAKIKLAFRRLARAHHPDVNPNDPQAARKMREIIEAYQVLSDPAKRASYDRQCGYDRVASSSNPDRSTASVRPNPPPPTRPAVPHRMSPNAEQELTRYAIRQIKRGVHQSDIIYQVCLMSDLLWPEAEELVSRIEVKHPHKSPKWIRTIYIIIIASAVAAAVIAMIVAVVLFSTPAGRALVNGWISSLHIDASKVILGILALIVCVYSVLHPHNEGSA